MNSNSSKISDHQLVELLKEYSEKAGVVHRRYMINLAALTLAGVFVIMVGIVFLIFTMSEVFSIYTVAVSAFGASIF